MSTDHLAASKVTFVKLDGREDKEQKEEDDDIEEQQQLWDRQQLELVRNSRVGGNVARRRCGALGYSFEAI